MRSLIVLTIFIFHFSSCAQSGSSAALLTPLVNGYPIPLGETILSIQVSIYDSSSKLAFVHLHDDEQTAKEATRTFLEKHGGTLISLQNNGQRLITFTLRAKNFTFDPNRMFTRNGIVESLNLFQSYSAEAVAEIEIFAASFLSKIPDSSFVIAVHNNTNNNYSVLDYLPEGALQGEAEKVHISNNMDADDFVFTTDYIVFEKLQKQDINAVLQKNKPATDDGSLSIFFGKKGKAYTNVEAEHKHSDVQLQLLKAVAGTMNNHYDDE